MPKNFRIPQDERNLLVMYVDEYVAKGVSPTDACRLLSPQFGGVHWQALLRRYQRELKNLGRRYPKFPMTSPARRRAALAKAGALQEITQNLTSVSVEAQEASIDLDDTEVPPLTDDAALSVLGRLEGYVRALQEKLRRVESENSKLLGENNALREESKVIAEQYIALSKLVEGVVMYKQEGKLVLDMATGLVEKAKSKLE